MEAAPGVGRRPRRGPSAAGYVLVLVGVVGWVVGCFLPYITDGTPFHGMWFNQNWTGLGGVVRWTGQWLFLFGGAATVGTIALWGIGRWQAWTPRALAATTAAWTLTWIGVLILWDLQHVQHSFHEVGYWVLLASLGVAIIGTVVVLVSAGAHVREPTAGTSSIEVEGRAMSATYRRSIARPKDLDAAAEVVGGRGLIAHAHSIATPGVETRPMSGPSAAGYVIVLVGVVGFVVGCFLPYASGEPFGWQWFIREGSAVSALLYLFAGATTVAIIALWGIGRRRAWTPRALAACAAAWTITWIGVLIAQGGFPHEVGYWVLLASVGVAILGTVVVLVSARRTLTCRLQAAIAA